MDEQQALRRDRLQRRVERSCDEEQTCSEGCSPPRGRPVAAHGPGIGGGRPECEPEEHPFERELGGAHAVTRRAVRCTRRRSRKNTSTPRVSSWSAIITTPAICWSLT